MTSYISLTKTFIKSLAMSKGQDKRRKLMITTLSIFAIFGIMLPGALLTGFFVNIMTNALIEVGLQTIALRIMLYVITIFTMIFSINVILNELYFSDDIEKVLPWPLRIWQLVASKFTASYIAENLMQIVFVIACIIGYGLASNLPLTSWIIGIISIPFLTLIPSIYCAIIAMLIMRFTKIIKNKDIAQKVTIFIVFLALIFILGLASLIKDFNLDVFVNNISNINSTNLKILDYIFINIHLFINAIEKSSILSFIGYIIVNILAVILMLLVAELTYYKGLINLTVARNRKSKKTLSELINSSKEKPPAISYFLKEVRILYRTPIFYTHCLISNFIWPIFFYAIYKALGTNITISWIRENYLFSSEIKLIIITFIVGISAFISSLNGISSNAISREGKHFHFMKSIPLSYNIQWQVKTWVGIIFALLGVMIFFIPGCIILKIPFIHIMIYVLLGSLSTIFSSYLGIYIDSIQPKLVWDDELSALRENYNMFFSMAIIITFIGLVSFGGYFILKNLNLSFLKLIVIFLSLLIICNIIIYIISKNNIFKNIKEQEEM